MDWTSPCAAAPPATGVHTTPERKVALKKKKVVSFANGRKKGKVGMKQRRGGISYTAERLAALSAALKLQEDARGTGTPSGSEYRSKKRENLKVLIRELRAKATERQGRKKKGVCTLVCVWWWWWWWW
jgi:hypothetical protein